MRAALQRLARLLWGGRLGWSGALLGFTLLPFSAVWRVVTAIRNRTYDRRGGEVVAGLTVVSVGNLAVGGTGKTPFSSWVVRVLAAAGRRPAVLLRGYGHDEELLHRRWTPDVPVVAGPDRVAGARQAVAGGANVAVLDDGFQHRRLGRQLDIVLLAVEDRFPGPVLPRGPYREPADALARADAVVLTRRSAGEPEARATADAVTRRLQGTEARVLGCVHLVGDGLVRLSQAGGARPTVDVERQLESPMALTAIARPHAFLRDVAERSRGRTELRSFGDHHDFTARDAEVARRQAGDRPIIVTEKDAVKLEAFADVLGEVWVLRQRMVWDWGESEVRELLGGAS